jgi:dihydroorotate dehydrogenase electron transfer subunit
MQSNRGQFEAVVGANVPLCREHFRLVLRLQTFPPTDPGQFVQIACRDLGENFNPEREWDWQSGQQLDAQGVELQSPLAMLRRPFSLAGRREVNGQVELDIIHRVVGVGTGWMSRLKPGDSVYILGPLGNRFELPPEGGLAILVGGGVGIPPMIYLAERLAGRKAVGRKAVVFAGALTRDLLPLTVEHNGPVPTTDGVEPLLNIAEFSRHGIPAVITTDDGSYGYRGFVTQALEAYLDRISNRSPLVPVIYTCGPEPMMKRVADIAARRGLVCQIAVERAMACGMGTCQSCCIRVKKADPHQPPLAGQDWAYRLACTDGPVFRGSDLLW